MPPFTPTERRMLAMLADGLPHRKKELHLCLGDELSDFSTVRVHIHNIRKKLRRYGQDIVCELSSRRIFYRHVRSLHHCYSDEYQLVGTSF